MALSGGMRVDTAALPKRHRPDAATWIIPGLGLDNAGAVAAGLAGADAQRAIQAVAAHAARGGRVAASCSAVFLLQAAGLLAGRRATTSWWMAAELRRLEPRCTVDADRMVCADGPVSTAGAAFAQTDLMLHLRAQFGVGLADAVGRVLLIDGRQAQAPFVVPAMLSNGNELVARLMARIEAAPPEPAQRGGAGRRVRDVAANPVAARARGQGPEHAGTGAERAAASRARMLIESSRMSIERVAEQVGYGDATALRRLMRKSAGANPSRYRPAGVRS